MSYVTYAYQYWSDVKHLAEYRIIKTCADVILLSHCPITDQLIIESLRSIESDKCKRILRSNGYNGGYSLVNVMRCRPNENALAGLSFAYGPIVSGHLHWYNESGESNIISELLKSGWVQINSRNFFKPFWEFVDDI